MAIKVVDIADEIHRELGSPSDLSISAISYWLRTNIGQLNNLICRGNFWNYIRKTFGNFYYTLTRS